MLDQYTSCLLDIWSRLAMAMLSCCWTTAMSSRTCSHAANWKLKASYPTWLAGMSALLSQSVVSRSRSVGPGHGFGSEEVLDVGAAGDVHQALRRVGVVGLVVDVRRPAGAQGVPHRRQVIDDDGELVQPELDGGGKGPPRATRVARVQGLFPDVDPVPCLVHRVDRYAVRLVRLLHGNGIALREPCSGWSVDCHSRYTSMVTLGCVPAQCWD